MLSEADLSKIRARLRDPLADAGAENLAQQALLEHFRRLPARPAGSALPLLWRGGLGEAAFGLLVDYLVSSPLSGEAFEWIVTDLREALLAAPAAADRDRLTEVAAALAVHAFRCEYVLAESRSEAAAVERLRADLTDPYRLAVYAAYRPLHRLPEVGRLAERLQPSPGTPLALLLQTHVAEPLAEQALKPQIPRLTAIADPASQKVRAQYEEHPYPRWHRLHAVAADETMAPTTRERQLIAGCGTGQHPVAAARHAPHVDFLAVDLSLASLAYATRKAREYGVKNLEFAQADLLRLPETGLNFDAISCVGVVHHLARPLEGLQALRAVMKGPSGLKIAVYTESGRAGIVAAIRLREEFDLEPSGEGIREFRQMVYALPPSHAARQLVGMLDFYSVSGCRDLAFHVVEHRYTLPAFAQLAARAGLRLERVLAPDTAVKQFRARYKNADPNTDIDAWTEFEAEHPGCFGSMYRFMLAKA